MGDPALARLGRAAVLALLSTVTALGFHVLGGGHAPQAAGAAVPLALSFAVAVQLAGVTLTRWRIAVAAGASQVAFHFLFGLGADPGGAMVMGPHAAHDIDALHFTPGTHDAMTQMHSMPLAHVAAALATYVIIRRGDLALGLLATALRAITPRLMSASTRGVPTFRAPLPVTAAPTSLASRGFTPVGMRAPPVAG